MHTITKGTKRTLVPLEHAIVSSLRTLLHALSTLSTIRTLRTLRTLRAVRTLLHALSSPGAGSAYP